VSRTLPGALVLSLDFELHWGVRDHTPADSPYRRNLLATREVVPRTLDLFESFGVAATWATVGMLFARTRADLERFRPRVLPSYADPSLSPYDEPVGEGEADDPLHYAANLVERIAATPLQEVGTHTYGHYFTNEPGQTLESFRADLDTACAIAAARGVTLRSIVFPRNQVNPAYAEALRERGIVAYRGNPPSWMWRFEDREQSLGWRQRGGRLADAYLNVGGHGTVGWEEIPRPDGLADVRASRVVRPYSPRLRHLEPLRLRRMQAAVRDAAERGRVAHLWWHPHNFGAHPDECLRFLRGVLEEYALCRDRHGMRSLSMSEAAALALGTLAAPASTSTVPAP
jgi:peptidoglycan/xylan/chitin deacetylase (PgdA/CDA1 family)